MKSDLPQPDAKVSLEALLRLKRAERPPAEFWAEFDAGLRRKQLVAIVERPSWWSLTRERMARWSWLGLPVGGAAALVFTFVQTPPQSEVNLVASAAAPAPVEVVPVPTASVQTDLIAQAESEPAPVASATPAGGLESLVSEAARWSRGLTESSSTLSALSPWRRPADPLSAASVEEALRLPRAVIPTVMGTTEPQVREDVKDSLVESSDPKLARLMAYAETSLSTARVDTSKQVRTPERATRRLSDRVLDDRISRLDMGGNHVTIRF